MACERPTILVSNLEAFLMDERGMFIGRGLLVTKIKSLPLTESQKPQDVRQGHWAQRPDLVYGQHSELYANRLEFGK